MPAKPRTPAPDPTPPAPGAIPGPIPGPIPGAALWWARRERLLLAAILLLAAALRAAAILELRGTPVLHLHEWTETDMHHYHAWAAAIAGGDILSSGVEPPFGRWARDQFASEEEWRRLIGAKTFYQDPLYPYALALWYRLFGADPVPFLFFQAALGALAVLLVHRAAKLLLGACGVGAGGALAAALLAALYGPSIFYELKLVREGPMAAAGLVVLLALVLLRERPAPFAWGGAGALIGLFRLLKGTASVLFLAVLAHLLWLAWRRRVARRLFILAAALFAAGYFLMQAPVFARNALAGAPLLKVSGNAAAVFICTNAADILGQHQSPVSSHTAEILRQTEGRLVSTVWKTIATHRSIGGFLRLQWEKFWSSWSSYERPNNSNFYYARRFSWVLTLLPSFLIIGAPAALGIVLGLRERRLLPLHLVFFSGYLPLLIFTDLGRYRYPLAPFLIIYAVYTGAAILRWMRSGRLELAGAALAGVVLFAGASEGLARARPANPIEYSYFSVGGKHYLRAGKFPEAVEEIVELNRRFPGNKVYADYLAAIREIAAAEERLRGAGGAAPPHEREMIMRRELARLYYRIDEIPLVERQLRELIRLDPANPDYPRELERLREPEAPGPPPASKDR